MVDVQSKNQKPSYTTTFLVVKLELDYQQTRSAALSLWQKGMDKDITKTYLYSRCTAQGNLQNTTMY